MSKRVRPFIFVNYDLSRDDDWYQAFMRQHRATYLCYGVEVCPTTDRMHHQGYLYFQDCKTKSSVVKMLKPNHVEICEGSVEQNIVYCSKDGDFHEFGERPADNGIRKSLLDVLTAVATRPEAELLQDPTFNGAETWARNYRAIREYASIMTPDRTEMTRLYIYWGKSNCGKSYNAFLEGARPMFYDGRFFDYHGEKKVVLEDMDPDNVPPRNLMLRLIDRYPMTVPIKGGFQKFVATDVYITTNYRPEHLFPYFFDPAFQRRITEIKMYNVPYKKDETQVQLVEEEEVLQETSDDSVPSLSGIDLNQESTHA